MYHTVDIDSGDAIRTFMMPADEKNWNTGLYQFKEALYRTKGLDLAGSISMTEDELRILVENFERIYGDDPEKTNLLEVDRLRTLLGDLQQVTDREDRNNIVRENFPVSKLGKATVHFANDICQFVCPRCRRLYFESQVSLDRKYNHYRCPKCNRTLQITPVWVLKEDNTKSPTTPLPVWTNGLDHGILWQAWKNRTYPRCPKCNRGNLDIFVSLNPARLMESSRIVCSSCRSRFGIHSQNYALTSASENLTQPFIATTYSRSTLELGKRSLVELLGDSSTFDDSLVAGFWFSPRAKVKEILLGYWYGANIRRIYQARRFGIEMNTGALYLKLKPDYFQSAISFLRKAYEEHPVFGPRYKDIESNNQDLHRLVLHSIAHAILSRLPLVSGVSMDSFQYLYDLTADSLLVYERAPGGLGACAELSKIEENSGAPIALDFFQKLKDDVVRCTCDDRCKYCIAIQGCSEWNKALSRFALGPLLKVFDESTMTWGF